MNFENIDWTKIATNVLTITASIILAAQLNKLMGKK